MARSLTTAFNLMVAILLVVPQPASGANPASGGVALAAPRAALADLEWLVGQWAGTGLGGQVNEVYSAPRGGQMAGHFSASRAGRPQFYEFLLIAEVNGSLELRVRHFNPDMTAWEGPTDFVRFPLVAVSDATWKFDGLTIRRTGPDAFEQVVRIRHRDGTETDSLLRYRRVAPAPKDRRR